MDSQFMIELKQLILDETEKSDVMEWQELSDSEPLLGSESRLGLDSLDALQISMAVKQRYGVRIEGARDSRKAMKSVITLAEYIQKHQHA